MPKKRIGKYVDEYRKQRKRIQNFIYRAAKRGEYIPADVLPDIPKNITQASVNRLKKLTAKKLHEKATRFVNPVTHEEYENINFVAFQRKVKAAKQHKKEETADRAFRDQLERELKALDLKEQLEKELKKLQEEEEKIKKKIRDFDTEEPEDTPVDINTEIYDKTIEDLQDFTPLSHWSPGLTDAKIKDKNILESMLNGAIEQDGKDAVMQRLSEHAEEINELVQEIIYGSGSVEGNFKDGNTVVNHDLTRFAEIIYGRHLNAEENRVLTDIRETITTGFEL